MIDPDWRPTFDELSLAEASHEAMRQTVVDHDQRIARFLTAIAFFVTAGFSALSLSDLRSATFVLSDGTTLHLLTILVAMFLALSAMAALLLVVSSGPPEAWDSPYHQLPSYVDYSQIEESKGPRYAEALSTQSADALLRYKWEALTSRALTLARRAAYKNGRILKARAAFFLAITPLTIAIVLIPIALSSDSGHRFRFSWMAASLTGVVIGIITLTAIADRSHYEIPEDDETPKDGETSKALGTPRKSGSAKRTFGILGGLFGAFAILCSLSSLCTGTLCWQDVFGVGALISCVFAWGQMKSWRRRRKAAMDGEEKRILDSLQPWMLLVPGLLEVSVMFLPDARLVNLMLALLPLIIFEGVRLAEGFDWDRRDLVPDGGIKSWQEWWSGEGKRGA